MADGISSKAASRAGVSVFVVIWLFTFWYAQLARIIETIKSWSPIAGVTGQNTLTPVANQGDGFEISVQQTLKWEGNGCDDDPADQGGLTCKGITDSEYRAYRQRKGLPAQSVIQINDQELQEIYKGYWDRCNAGSKPMPLAFAIFDTCVNFDESQVKDWFESLPDDPKQAALTIMDRRIQYRHQRVAEQSSQGKFLQGWLNRDNDAKQFIEAYQTPVATARGSTDTARVAPGAAAPTGGDPRQSVLKVKAGREWGSCFVAAPGICVTNAHVMEQSSTATLFTLGGQQFQASLLRKGTTGPHDPDVAILRIQGGESLPALPAGTPRNGAMQLIGYGYGKDQTVVSGQIREISDRIIYSGDNQPGKSGGAIIQDGRWVGLNVAQSSRGQEAIKPDQVNHFLQSATSIPALQGRKTLI